MEYQVYNAPAELRSFVKCFWTLEDTADAVPMRQRVVPDGCMEMIFHYGDVYRQFFEDGSSVLQPRCFIYGQITKYLEIAPTGRSGMVAARFYPHGLAPFLDCPVASLEDKAVSLSTLFGEKGINLENAVLSASTNDERLESIQTFLVARLSEQSTIDAITRSCVEAIMHSQGKIDVSQLAERMNLHRRNLERRFSSTIGMSPKQLSRAIRLQTTIRMLEQKQFTSLTALAYENGYYDQAHFIKDFKEFTGISPSAFYAEHLQFAALFAADE